jgi:riboflavin synthase
MFTGIIAEVGRVERVGPRSEGIELTVRAPATAASAATGDSIAIDGCCLTVERFDRESFTLFASLETLSQTTIGGLRPGAVVNVESAMRAGGKMGGHIVQGHIDAVGRLVRLDRLGEGWTLGVRLPAVLLPEVVQKGSIALHGISLTVARLDGDVVEVAIIPTTYSGTSLRDLAVGAPINVETDVIGKYVVKTLRGMFGEQADAAAVTAAAKDSATHDLLQRAGFVD